MKTFASHANRFPPPPQQQSGLYFRNFLFSKEFSVWAACVPSPGSTKAVHVPGQEAEERMGSSGVFVAVHCSGQQQLRKDDFKTEQAKNQLWWCMSWKTFLAFLSQNFRVWDIFRWVCFVCLHVHDLPELKKFLCPCWAGGEAPAQGIRHDVPASSLFVFLTSSLSFLFAVKEELVPCGVSNWILTQSSCNLS